MSSNCDSIYRDLYIDIYKNPKNFGKLKNYDVKARDNTNCGDDITIYLKIENNRIKDVKFEGKGCVISIVSASILTQNIKSESIDKINSMNAKELFEIMGIDLMKNPTKAGCALLSLKVVKKAIEEYKNKSKK